MEKYLKVFLGDFRKILGELHIKRGLIGAEICENFWIKFIKILYRICEILNRTGQTCE